MKFSNTISNVMICSVAAALSLIAVPAAADQESPKLTVAFISDAAQGRKIDNQQYDSAIAELEDSKLYGIRGFYAANNLCVSYLKVGDAAQAEIACNAAVERMESLQQDSRVARDRFLASDYQRLYAIALSNRGVINYINDKPEMARDDFEAAIESDADVREAQLNLARLAELASAA